MAQPARSRWAILLAGATFAAALAVLAALWLVPPPAASAKRDPMAGKGLDTPPAFTAKTPPQPAPPLRFRDGSGRMVDLASLSGRPLVLNLWATWCAPCRTEMPALARLNDRLAASSGRVIALSLDTGDQALVRRFLTEIGAAGLEAFQDPSLTALTAFRAPGLPTTIFIDAQGRITGTLVGPADWDSPALVALVAQALG